MVSSSAANVLFFCVLRNFRNFYFYVYPLLTCCRLVVCHFWTIRLILGWQRETVNRYVYNGRSSQHFIIIWIGSSMNPICISYVTVVGQSSVKWRTWSHPPTTGFGRVKLSIYMQRPSYVSDLSIDDRGNPVFRKSSQNVQTLRNVLKALTENILNPNLASLVLV